MSIMGIIILVGHCVVHINTFVIEQLSVGDHGSVLEVFTEAAGDQVYVNPSYIGCCEDAHIEPLRILFGNIYQFLLL